MFLLGIICYTTIDIWGATSGSLDTENNDEIMFNINVPNISIVFFDIRGYNMTAKDQNDKELFFFQEYTRCPYIDFGSDRGTIFFKKTETLSYTLHYSVTIFPNYCSDLRIISIGDSHYLRISDQVSQKPNELISKNNMDYCMWFVSKSTQEFIINYETERSYDFFTVHYNDQSNYYTGIGNLNIYAKSMIIVWKTDFSVVSKGISIESYAYSSFATETYYYLANDFAQIPVSGSRLLFYDIQSFKTFSYSKEDFDGFVFLSSKIDTSIAFHNKNYQTWLITQPGKELRIQSNEIKFFDFGHNIGYCLLDTSDLFVKCTFLCYSCLEYSEICSNHRSVSYGNNQVYLLSNNPVENIQINRSVSIEKGCLWMTSSVLSEYYIRNRVESPNIIRIQTPKTSVTLDSNQNVAVYEQSFLLMWDIKSNTNEFFMVQSKPNDNNEIYDDRNVGIQYYFESFAFASPQGMSSRFKIEETSFYNMFLSNSNSIELILSSRNMVISIETTKLNDTIEISGITMNGNIVFLENIINDSYFIEVGIDLSKIHIKTAQNTSIEIIVNCLDLNLTQIKGKCINGLVALVGRSNKIEISSGKYDDDSKIRIPYINQGDICIWIPFRKQIGIKLSSQTEIGYDRLYFYTQSDIIKGNHPRIVSGNQITSFNENEQLVLIWEATDLNMETNFKIEYFQDHLADFKNQKLVSLKQQIEQTRFFIQSDHNFSSAPKGLHRNLSVYMLETKDYEIDVSNVSILEVVVPIGDTILTIHNYTNLTIDLPIFEINRDLDNTNKTRYMSNGTYYFYKSGRRLLIKSEINEWSKIIISCLILGKEKSCDQLNIAKGSFSNISINSSTTKNDSLIACFWITSSDERQYYFSKSNSLEADSFEVSYYHSRTGYSKKKYHNNQTTNHLVSQSIFVVWNHSSGDETVSALIQAFDQDIEDNTNFKEILELRNINQKPQSKNSVFIVLGILLSCFLLFSKCKAFIHYSKEIYDNVVNKNEPFELSDQEKVEEIEASTIMKNVSAYEEEENTNDDE